MTLAPKLPPGRANRKALQFAVDIHRLRNAGYTFSAIRCALLDAGISVSLSTIKREAARRGSLRRARTASNRGAVPHVGNRIEGCKSRRLVGSPPTAPGASGREIAEAFFNAHPSNPLFPTQESS